MALFEPKQPTVHIPIFGSDEVADVTGAGDTVIATMTLALAAGASFYEAARLANYAGGLVVMKRGTATVSARELATRSRRSRHVGRELVAGRPAQETVDGVDVTRQSRSRARSSAVARDRAAGRTHRVCQRLLRPAARRPRALPARRPRARPTGWSSPSTTMRSVRGAEGAGPADAAGGRSRRARRRRCAAWTTSSSFPSRPWQPLLELLQPGRALQGHRLHRRHRARARDRARLRRPHRHRRRREGPFDARSASHGCTS